MGIDIIIDNNFRVTSDSRQYIIHTFQKKNGKLQYDKNGEIKCSSGLRKYCSSFKGVLQIISEETIRQSTATNFEELIDVHKKVEKFIENIHEVVNEKFSKLETLDNLNNLVITEIEDYDKYYNSIDVDFNFNNEDDEED